MSTPERRAEALLLHDRFVRGLARALVVDAHAADDLTQDAWLAALRRGERAESLPRWLAGVVRHLAAKGRRGEARRARREQDAARPEATPSAREILEREALRARVVRAVLALGQPYREAVLLRYFEGLAPRAIARRLGVPVETVRTRLKRALASLRAVLASEHQGEPGAWSLALAPFARPLRASLPSLPLLVMTLQAKLILGVAGAGLVALLLLPDPRALPVEPHADRTARPEAGEGPGALSPRLAPPELAPSRTALEAGEPLAPSDSPEAFGSLLVRVTWWDGTPAGDVRARIEPAWRDGDPSWRALEAVTDAAGEFLLEHLPPGAACVELDRGEGEIARVEVGQRCTSEITLALGFDFTGTVLDPSGGTVAGAEVWLSYSHDSEEGNVVAHSDALGRFRVRSCGGGYVGARAPGYAPSLLTELRAAEGSELALELVLMGPGGALAGTVRDPKGRPVASALVLVGEPGKWRDSAIPVGGERSITGMRPHPRVGRTDELGRYAFEGLAPGLQPLVVRAPGFGLWRGEAAVLEHGRTTLDVELGPGVTLVGRVVDPEQRPLDAQVSIGHADGRFGTWTHTDPDGRFRLEDLEPGELEVIATHERARTSAMLRGAAGETLSWEAVLEQGGAIRGRLVDERGVGLAGWFVVAEDEPPRAPDACATTDHRRTDAQGRFVFEGLGQHRHHLEAFDPRAPWRYPSAVGSGVVPGGEEVVLRVDPELRSSVRIRGTVVDESGRALANAVLRASQPDFRRGLEVTSAPDGSFELGPGPPGDWSLRVGAPEHPDCPELALGPRALGADETWECGSIALLPGGTLLAHGAPGPGGSPSLAVLRGTSFHARMLAEGASWRSQPLAPGEYRLALLGEGIAAALLPFEVHSGATTELEIPLAAGLPVSVRVAADSRGTGRRPVLRIDDANGTTCLEQELWFRPDGDYGLELALAPGSYRLEAWLAGGGKDGAEIAVGAQGGGSAVVLELR